MRTHDVHSIPDGKTCTVQNIDFLQCQKISEHQ